MQHPQAQTQTAPTPPEAAQATAPCILYQLKDFTHAATKVYCVRKSIHTFKHGFSAVGRKLCGKMLRNKARDHISFHIEYFYVSRLKTRHNH
jgi:hypothetical protein